MARIQPNELDLWIAPPAESGGGTFFVDIAQCLSLVNRKFYRQGYQYVISNVEMFSLDVSNPVSCQIFRLPNHWPMVNSWVKGLSVWRESQDQILDDDPSLKSKYSDFKVYMNSVHRAANPSANFVNNLIPLDYEVDFTATDPTAHYDWDPSEIQIPNDPTPGATTGYNVHVLNDDVATSKGLIKGYSESRSRPNAVEPNLVSGEVSWMTQAFDVGDNLPEIRADIEFNNDSPPYPVGRDSAFEFYPGGGYQGDATQLQDILSVRAGSTIASDSSGPFMANCGLLQLTFDSDDVMLKISIAQGEYRGIMARPMQEVN